MTPNPENQSDGRHGRGQIGPSEQLSLDIPCLDSTTFSALRTELFGTKILAFLNKQKTRKGSEVKLQATIKQLTEDGALMDRLQNANTNPHLELLTYMADKMSKGHVGTRSFYNFSEAWRKHAPPQFRELVPLIRTSFKAYVDFLTSLHHPRVATYLNSAEFISLPPNERLLGIVGKIDEFGLPLGSGNLSHIHSMLPQRFGSRPFKSEIETGGGLPLKTWRELRSLLVNENILDWLASDQFAALSPRDRLARLFEESRRLNLPLSTSNLGQVWASLPAKFGPELARADFARITRTYEFWSTVRQALTDPRVVDYCCDQHFRSLSAQEKLLGLKDTVKRAGYSVGQASPLDFYYCLPDTLPGAIQTDSELSATFAPSMVVAQVRAALTDARMKDFLHGTALRTADREDRLYLLAKELREHGLCVDISSLETLYNALPGDLPGGMRKEDFYLINCGYDQFIRIREALREPVTQTWLDSEKFQRSTREDKLIIIMDYLIANGVDVANITPRDFYTVLPNKLSANVLKKDILAVDVPRAVYDRFRDAFQLVTVVGWLHSDDFKEMAPEDRFIALIELIENTLGPLESESYKSLYSALPYRLSEDTWKGDFRSIEVSRKVQRQVLLAIQEPLVIEFVSSPAFQVLNKTERSAELLREIRSRGLQVDTDNLRDFCTALPSVVVKGICNRCDFASTNLTLKFFDQLRDALKQPAVETWLVSDEFRNMDPSQRMRALHGKIRSEGYALDTDNLFALRKALPDELAAGVLKSEFAYVNMSAAGQAKLESTLKDARMVSYLSSDEFGNIPAEQKLVALVKKAREFKLNLGAGNLSQIHSALPKVLPGGVLRAEITTLYISIDCVDQIDKALCHPALRSYLGLPGFARIAPHDKLANLFLAIRDLRLRFDSDNLGILHLLLPEILPGGIKKQDIPRVFVNFEDYRDFRSALTDPRIISFFKSEEFRQMTGEDRMAALFEKMLALDIAPETRSIYLLHTALPDQLPGGYKRSDIFRVHLTLDDFRTVRNAVQSASFQARLETQNFAQLSPKDKLAFIYEEILRQGYQLQLVNLGQLHGGLPARLSPSVRKTDLYGLDISYPSYMRTRDVASIEEVYNAIANAMAD